MPVNSTGRPILSDLVKGYANFGNENAVRFNFDTVAVEGAGTTDNIGIPLIWDNASGKFEVYVAQVIATVISTGGSPLKDGSVLGLSVGDKLGLGMNKEDTNLADAAAQMTILYRGDAAISETGLVWGSADAGAQTAFLAQLELQRITTVDNATVVSPTYTS